MFDRQRRGQFGNLPGKFDVLPARQNTAPNMGLQQVGADGGEGSGRTTELMRLLVEGNVVSTIDLNGHPGMYLLLFDGGPVVGDDFRIEFTRERQPADY